MLFRSIVFAILALGSFTPAQAHLGHLGEVAGHSHWIGLGAVVVAGVIAAALGTIAKADDDGEEADEPADDTETAGQGETA